MEDEDDVDIIGEFNEVALAPSSCGTYDEMGLNINEFLPYFGSNTWLLNTDQVWNLDNNIDDKSKASIEKILQEDRETTHFAPNISKITTNLTSSSHKKPWMETEKDLFHQGLKTFGHSWTKISKFIGTRTTLQVKNFARQYLKQAERNASANQVAEQEGITPISTSFPENAFDAGSPTVPSFEMKSPRKKIPSDFDSGKHSVKIKKCKIVPSKEIVRINKESTSSDAEDIDIEDLEDVPINKAPEREFVAMENAPEHEKQIPAMAEDDFPDMGATEESGQDEDHGMQTFPDSCQSDDCISKDPKQEPNISTCTTKSVSDVQENNYSNCESDDESATRTMDESQHFQKSYDFDIPSEELVLERTAITDLEKTVHQEFFEGRSQKTPERYLKIRNYILDSWEKSKPIYLNKTSVRPGLKNCGDVNCIGRIHTYLEQVGAINFGCDQTVYSRPLVLLGRPMAIPKKQNQSSSLVHQFARMETMRSRKRKIPFFTYDSAAGGYTIEHGKDGEVIDVAERLDVAPPVKRAKAGEDPFRLIFCTEFNSDKPPPFSVAVHLEALLVMDVHAHLSALEVIGLMGGNFDQEQNVLHIVSAEPCESLSTGLECEMDPVSQTLASEKLQDEGYNVVGWYHSHPTFAPNPSVRDLETQAKFQEWFSQGGAPFLGVIITPHLCGTPFSKLRYLIVGEEVVNPDGYRLPYKFTPDVICSNKDADKFLFGIVRLIEKWKAGPSCSGGLKATLATLNKMLSSIHHHLSRTQMEQKAQNAILNEFGKTLVTHLISDEWTEPNAECESERKKKESSDEIQREQRDSSSISQNKA